MGNQAVWSSLAGGVCGGDGRGRSRGFQAAPAGGGGGGGRAQRRPCSCAQRRDHPTPYPEFCGSRLQQRLDVGVPLGPKLLEQPALRVDRGLACSAVGAARCSSEMEQRAQYEKDKFREHRDVGHVVLQRPKPAGRRCCRRGKHSVAGRKRLFCSPGAELSRTGGHGHAHAVPPKSLIHRLTSSGALCGYPKRSIT